MEHPINGTIKICHFEYVFLVDSFRLAPHSLKGGQIVKIDKRMQKTTKDKKRRSLRNFWRKKRGENNINCFNRPLFLLFSSFQYSTVDSK